MWHRNAAPHKYCLDWISTDYEPLLSLIFHNGKEFLNNLKLLPFCHGKNYKMEFTLLFSLLFVPALRILQWYSQGFIFPCTRWFRYDRDKLWLVYKSSRSYLNHLVYDTASVGKRYPMIRRNVVPVCPVVNTSENNPVLSLKKVIKSIEILC
jgi:hypothetical protein